MRPIYYNLIVTALLLTVLFTVFSAPAIDAATAEIADLTLVAFPENPSSGSEFTVSARSYTFDPLRVNFQWTLDGKVIASGRGLTEQTFTASKLGSTMKIGAAAIESDGKVYKTELIVNISAIDLIVRPLTYTPVFYRGAPLSSPGADIEIYAVPHLFSGNSRIAIDDLVYEWFIDDGRFVGQSGAGRNKFILKTLDAGGSSYNVTVKASSVGGSVSAQKSIRIRPDTPQILFYEANSLTGRKNLSRSTFYIQSGNSASILAEPYNFSLLSLKRALVSWSANGANIENTSAIPYMLEVSAGENVTSTTNFGLSVEDKKTLYQRVQSGLTVISTE